MTWGTVNLSKYNPQNSQNAPFLTWDFNYFPARGGGGDMPPDPTIRVYMVEVAVLLEDVPGCRGSYPCPNVSDNCSGWCLYSRRACSSIPARKAGRSHADCRHDRQAGLLARPLHVLGPAPVIGIYQSTGNVHDWSPCYTQHDAGAGLFISRGLMK